MIYSGRIRGPVGHKLLRRLAWLDAWRRHNEFRAAFVIVAFGAGREQLIVINGWGYSVCLN